MMTTTTRTVRIIAAMLSRISQSGGVRTLILMNIRIGEKNGMCERTMVRVESGARKRPNINIKGITNSITTGVETCCASSSLLQIAPMTAYSVEKRKNPMTK